MVFLNAMSKSHTVFLMHLYEENKMQGRCKSYQQVFFLMSKWICYIQERSKLQCDLSDIDYISPNDSWDRLQPLCDSEVDEVGTESGWMVITSVVKEYFQLNIQFTIKSKSLYAKLIHMCQCTVLCTSLEPPFISLHFTLKGPDFLVIF